MSNTIYKGYSARIEFSQEDNCLIGHVLGIQDIISFHGDSVSEIHTAFEEAVDDYLEMCAKTGKEPQKPFSGKMLLRLPPELHARLTRKAQSEGKSVNHLVTETLDQALNQQ